MTMSTSLRQVLRSFSSTSPSFEASSFRASSVFIGSTRTFFNSLVSEQPQNELQPSQNDHGDLPHFENVPQLMHYSDTNASTLIPSSLSQLTFVLGEMISQLDIQQQSEGSKQLGEDQSLQRLFKILSESLRVMSVPDCITVLQSLSKIRQKLPTGSTLVNDTGNPILKRLVRHELEIDPDQIASLCFWLIEAGIFDLSLPRYLRETIPKICDQMSFTGVRTMLRALYNFDLRESALINPLADRLTNGVDMFNNDDVVDTFRLDAETNMVNRPCYLKLADMVSMHCELFSTNEIMELFSIACSLQHINPKSASSMVAFLQARIDVLSDHQIIQVLMGLMQIGERRYDQAISFLNTVLARRSVNDLTPEEALRIVYTICHYEVQECKSQLENGLQHYMSNLPQKIPLDHLAMLAEIFVSIENEFEGLQPIEIPENLRQAVDSYALSVTTHWKIKKHILHFQSQLPESHKVHFEADVVLGPYAASFVDESQKLVLEVVMPKSPVGFAMRRRHFERLGYTVLKLSGKAMLHNRHPAALLEIFTRALDSHAIESGKANPGDVMARKGRRDHQ